MGRLACLSVSALLIGGIAAAVPTPASAASTTSITIDGNRGGRVFDGVGAISGGGGNSRLLIDYPKTQRDQILDYLFKPGYGASLQILKVEIGGDANSTDGSESSHEPTRGSVSCNTGYEWWLMGEAKARNPHIVFSALAWAAPGWVGNGRFFTADSIDYLIDWLTCARSNGFDLRYLGGLNEKTSWTALWFEQLRAALDARGFGSVRIVAVDDWRPSPGWPQAGGWGVVDTLSRDSAFNKAVSVVGGHYPCHGNNGGDATTCPTPPGAVALGKPLWMSEGGSQDYNTGAAPWIRSIVRGYVDGSMTAFINWPVVAALYPNLKFATTGLLVADQPWSGTYTIGKSLWVNAQVTQFTQPGWAFVQSASGYLGGTEQNGTYMTLEAPGKTDYSTILETSTASSVQTIDVTVTGGLPTGTVHVWSTNLGSGHSTDWFVHQRDITPNGGRFSLTLQPNHIYSISTRSGQGRGAATGPGSGHLALPYADSFGGYPIGGEARYLAQQQGDFQSRPCTGRAGNCMRQMADRTPVFWGANGPPRASLGDLGWSDYTVTVRALLEQSGVVYLAGRIGSDSRRTNGFNGYSIRISDNGGWWLNENHTTGTQTTLANGTVSAPGHNRWITLSMTFNGNDISASINGKRVAAVTSSTYSAGQVGIGIEGWQTDQFADLSIMPGTSSAAPG